jgi:hypothetical protein
MRQKTTHYSRTREKPRLQCRQAKPRRVRRRICLLRSVSRPSFGCRKSGRFAPPTRGSSSEEKIANWGQKRLTWGDTVLVPYFRDFSAEPIGLAQSGAQGSLLAKPRLNVARRHLVVIPLRAPISWEIATSSGVHVRVIGGR